jgi:Holliday junction resolvase-like predicted endonuclease
MSAKKRRTRTKKRRQRAANEEVIAGPAHLKRVGKRIHLRTASNPAQFAEMRRQLAAWRAQAPAEMRADSEALLALVAGIDPLTALGFVFSHNHLAPQLAGKEMTETYAIVEHLALLLGKGLATGHEMRIEPDTSERLVEMLSEQLRKAIMLSQPELPTDGSLPPNEAFTDALQVIRSFELAVRVERYDHQQKALLRALFTPFAADLEAAFGFNCDDAMRVEDAYDQRIKATAFAGDDQAHEVMADVDRVLKGKAAQDPHTAELVTEIRAAAPKIDARMQMFWMLLLWNALRTGHSIAPTLDELVAETGLAHDVVNRVVNALTATADEVANYWFMVPMNPLKQHPLVNMDGHAALPSPGLFLPALQTMFEMKLKGTSRWEDYQKHRAAYGEDTAADLFARVLPGAAIYKNLKYRWAKGEGEVDVFVFFERRLFLIEVKSGDYADAARAGVESRVEETLHDLVLKAHEQVTRASEYIENVPSATFHDGGATIEIRRADIDEMHLISLTMEQLGHIVNTAKAMIYSGKATAPLTVSLDDLEVLADVLTRPAMFLHYIARREVYLPYTHIQNGDELGFLEAYLRTFLREEPSQYQGFDHVLMDPSSKTIDAFEHARGAGEAAPLPQPQIPSEVLTLLDNLAAVRPAGWLAASFMLLNLIPRQQRRLARNIRAFVHGKRVKEVAPTTAADGRTVASFRIDDPRLPASTGQGMVLSLDRALDVLGAESRQP